MASENVYQWIKKNRDLIGTIVLEVGSLQYDEQSSLDLRTTLCRGASVYIGCDLGPGENVDAILDMSDNFEAVDEKFQGLRFDTVF